MIIIIISYYIDCTISTNNLTCSKRHGVRESKNFKYLVVELRRVSGNNDKEILNRMRLCIKDKQVPIGNN